MDEGKHLILVLLRKANLEHKETFASDWLKSPIPMLLTHIRFFFFMFYILALRYEKPICSSRIRSIEEH